MKPEKLERASLDGCKLNLEALYRLAPSCFTEAEDDRKEAINVEKDGKQVRMAINFHTLRELLGDTLVDDNEELYAFTWPGKQAARREAAAPITDTLRPMPEDSEDWDKTENLYIEGDNLRVLKLLQKGYMGKVKMIYIDKSITRLIHSRDRGKGLKSPIFGGFSFCWDKAVEMKFGVGEETSSSYAHTLKR